LYFDRKTVGKNLVFGTEEEVEGAVDGSLEGFSTSFKRISFFSHVLFNKNDYRPKFGRAHSCNL